MRQYRTAVAVAATRPSHWRAEARRTAFLFQDGVLLAAACFAFDALELLDGKPYGAGGLPGTGYLGAAWHCLEATGWIETDPAPAWTERGLEALRHRARLVAGGAFLARFDDNAPGCWDTPWDVATQAAFAALLRDHERWRAGADPAHPLTAYLHAAPAVLRRRDGVRRRHVARPPTRPTRRRNPVRRHRRQPRGPRPGQGGARRRRGTRPAAADRRRHRPRLRADAARRARPRDRRRAAHK